MKSFEPTMDTIEDYNGNESNSKRKIVNFVIIGLLVVGAIYSTAHHFFGVVDDQIPEAPYLLKRF
jgi:hypothetical protein